MVGELRGKYTGVIHCATRLALRIEVGLLHLGSVISEHLDDSHATHTARSVTGAKTIVFCVDQEHADDRRKALNNCNTDITRKHPDYVVRVVSDEGLVGRRHLHRFQNPEQDYPVIVTNSKLLATGVDVPTCRNIVLFKPINSIVEFKQIIGRGTPCSKCKTRLPRIQTIQYTLVAHAIRC
jgi:type I site-specific restriction endonuclease